MNVYRQKRRVEGKIVESRPYCGRYRLPWMTRPKSVALKTADKQIAEKRLREFCRVQELEHESQPVPSNLWGAPHRNLADLLKEYHASLLAQARREKHARDTCQRIERLLAECDWQLVGDISAASFERWRTKGPDGAKYHKPLSPKTLKEYLVSMRAFLNWLVTMGFMDRDPLASVPQVDVRGRETRIRRAWTDEEFALFMARHPSGNVDYRPAVYLLSMTGLRREELQKLLWADVSLAGENPHLVVRAENSKNRRGTVLPLHPETADYLAKMQPAQVRPEESVLAFRIPQAKKLYRDLLAAGISPKNEAGCLDFHSLRKTFATTLSEQGVPVKVAQLLLRHSDANLTANTYTDVSRMPTADAMKSLPGRLEKRTLPCTLSPDKQGRNESQAGMSGDLAERMQGIEDVLHSLLKTLSVTTWQRGKMVGTTGFEPATPRPPGVCSTQAELRPD